MNIKLIDSLVEIINSLTEKERKILDQKLNPTILPAKTTLSHLKDEPFVGMWRDRQDMKDSSQWVRQLRQKEWGSADESTTSS
jgi:hypothetical protein